ncbi:MAG: tetratricopeptide repeat protein [Candidatus Paceibacterota bacterium]
MEEIIKTKNFGSKYRNTLLVLLGILVLFALYMIFDRGGEKDKMAEENLFATTTSDSEIKTNDIVFTGSGDYKIEQVPINDERGGLPSGMPNLDRQISFATNINFDESVKNTLIEKIKGLQSTLKADPTNFPTWIDLGIYYKMIGDFNGAIDIWVYATKLSPTDFVSRGNLGNIYAYNLKDMAQADVYYKQAISKDPSQVYLYIQLAEAYRDVGNNKNKALEVVNQGLIANPNNPALLNLKENLEK